MKDFLQRIEKLPPKHLVLLALEQKARIDKLERAQREPIAIVGIGCRFPGDVDSPESFWDLLASGRDGITEIPPDRFDVDAWYDPDPSVPGRIATRWGGFVRDVDRFDASFFGISRREAISMDPQQRMLLETSWEAMERAGVAPGSLSGSRLGVFFGLSTADYYQLLMRTGYAAIDGYTATGTAHSIAAGRLAYLLGVHGPNLVVDTACSSSLVALHLACQSLRAGECEMALAGGANLIALPETTISLSKARMLAPDGRCKSFDESADGFVRSEGCGVIVLKTLTRALEDRDNILAIIRGSAVNQDGRSSGLTAPNGLAQEKVIREAMESAGVEPSEVQYIEAHGTGTSLGDPIEAHALASVFGVGRSAQNRLYVGSAKSNIGHLEAAAGIAGIIKTVLSLQHESIPATLHFRQLNSHIDLKGAPLVVAAQNTPWPRGHRIAGVSSFGFSGTNVHVILEEAPARAHVAKATDSSYTLVVSARTQTALSALTRRYADYLTAHPDVSLGDFCYTASEGRNRFEYTVTLSAPSVEQMRAKLADVADGNDQSDSGSASVKTSGDKIALPVYPFERQRYWVEIRSTEAIQEHGEIGFYQLEWERKAVASQEHGVGPTAGLSADVLHAIGQKVISNLDPLSREHGLDRYVELQPELDRASSEYIMRALRECGWNPEIGELVRVEDLAVRLGIRSRYVRSLGRMLEILGEDRVLERAGQSWKVLTVAAPADTDADFPLLHAAYPQFRGELTFLKNCGAKLAQVMQGRLDALNLLFPDGSFETAEELYEKSGGAKVFQTLMQQVIAQMLERFPADRRIRILEVGGGTGGTASYVARVLHPDRVEYVFTDVSPLFAERGASKFRQYPFFRFEVLDMERDPEAQGFARNSFDIIIAANCVHATTDLRVSLRNIVKLLAPEGALVLLEGTRSERWVDVSFGLTDGWWKFTDHDLRTDYPLLSAELWCKVLSEIGCRDVVALPPDRDTQQKILMALSPAASSEKQPWLVVGDSGRMAKLVTERLAERGAASVVVSPSDTLPSRAGGWRGILDLAALDVPRAEDLSDAEWAGVHQFGCERMLMLARTLGGNSGRLWVVTRGAQRVAEEVMSTGIAAAPIWGLGRSIALEQPDIWGGLIDLDPSGESEEQSRLIVQELLGSDGGEDQIAFRQDERHVARLKSRAQPTARQIQFHSDASYLITGGLGGLGLVIARWMAANGARKLILVGRNGITRQQQKTALQEIEQLGASVRIAQTDVADPEQMAMLFRTIAAEESPLRGVIHAAAALSRDSVRDMSVETLREVLRPKVLGTWLLHRHTLKLNLDFFCLFASTASLLGSGGLAHYAAGNQFLDAFAQYRRSLGLPALSIDWGTWDEMRTVSQEDRIQYRSVGLLPMASADALAVLGNLLQSEESSVMAAAINWRTLRAVFEARRKRPLLESIEQQGTAQPAQIRAADAVQWQELPTTERESRLMQLVWEETCRVLQIEGNTPIEPDRGFFEMGMDSLVSVELKSRLEAHLGRTLPAMMTFNFPNVRALSHRLAEEFASPVSGNGTKVEPGPLDSSTLNDEEVARRLTEKLSRIQNLVGSR